MIIIFVNWDYLTLYLFFYPRTNYSKTQYIYYYYYIKFIYSITIVTLNNNNNSNIWIYMCQKSIKHHSLNSTIIQKIFINRFCKHKNLQIRYTYLAKLIE